MKKLLLMAGIICLLVVPALAWAGSCDPNTSQTKVVVTIDGKDMTVCGVAEAYEEAFVKREGAKADDLNNQAVPIQVRDFESGNMFNFYDGFYVIEHTMKVENAGDPPILGFSSRERAWTWWEKKMKEIGGRVVNFETATREFRKDKTGPSKGSIAKQDAAASQVDMLLKKKQK